MKFDDIKTGQEYKALFDHAGYGYKKDDVYKVNTINKANLIITILNKNGHCAAVPFVVFDHDFKLHVVPVPAPVPVQPAPVPVQPAPISPPMPPGVSINTKTGAIVGVDPATEDDGEYLVYDTKPSEPERAPLNDFVPEKDKLKNYFMSKKRLSD